MYPRSLRIRGGAGRRSHYKFEVFQSPCTDCRVEAVPVADCCVLGRSAEAQKSRVDARLLMVDAEMMDLLPFAELVRDQGENRLHRFGFIRAFGFDRHRAAD